MDRVECIVPGCGRKPKTRGLCPACYQNAVRAISAGKATWEQLVEIGLALDAKTGKGENLFGKALEDRLAEAQKQKSLAAQPTAKRRGKSSDKTS